MAPSRQATRTKARTATLLLAVAALLLLIPPGAAGNGDSVTWQGNGSENVGECEFGYHWVFTTGGAVVRNVQLHTEIENQTQPPIPMDQAGPSGTPSSWHANTTIVDTDENVTPFVTFQVMEEGQGNKILTISDCAEGDGPNGPAPCIGPQDIRGSAEAGPPRNELEWDAFVNATGYNLYRSEEGGPFVQIAQTDGNTTSFDDFNVTVGNEYTYRVTAQVGEEETDHCDEITLTAIPVFPGVLAGVAAAAVGVGAYAVSRRRKD